MPRRRSSLARKADSGWHHIERFSERELLLQSSSSQEFFTRKFNDPSRLEVEIGSGSGSFLLEAAAKFPQTTFWAIEYADRFLKALRDQVLERNLSNILLISCDAKVFLQTCIPEETVDAFHIYFPDPWPRRSQQKKRFLTAVGLELLNTRLKPGGKLYFTTDFQSYAESVDPLLQNHAQLRVLKNQVFKGPQSPINASYVAYGLQTHFGERFVKQGKPIFVRVCQKNPENPF